MDLVFRASGAADLIPQLEQGELDLGLVIDDTFSDPRLYVEALCPEPLTLLAHPAHPLATCSKLMPQDLRDQPFLLTDLGCAYRSKLEKVLARAHVIPKAMMEFTSVETIKQCATLGMGIACLPASVAQSEIAAGKLVALSWPGTDLTMRTLMVRHKDKWLSPAMEAFLSLLRDRLIPTEPVQPVVLSA